MIKETTQCQKIPVKLMPMRQSLRSQPLPFRYRLNRPLSLEHGRLSLLRSRMLCLVHSSSSAPSVQKLARQLLLIAMRQNLHSPTRINLLNHLPHLPGRADNMPSLNQSVAALIPISDESAAQLVLHKPSASDDTSTNQHLCTFAVLLQHLICSACMISKLLCDSDNVKQKLQAWTRMS